MPTLGSRLVLLLALVGSALSAHGQTAYTNVIGDSYAGQGYNVAPIQTLGYGFTSGATGEVAEFRIAMNNGTSTGSVPFTLGLYSDAGGSVGTLLGSYSGVSTGVAFANARSQFATVPASGPTLVNGTAYWLLASSSNNLVWNWVGENGPRQPTVFGAPGGNLTYGSFNSGAFSVRVNSVPEPASLATLAIGAVALLRRRKG